MLTPQAGIQVDKFEAPIDWQYSFPEGYTRLEYLESSGTQYIDTGYVPTNTTKWILDAQFTETTNLDQINGRVDTTVSPSGQRISIGISPTQYISEIGFTLCGGGFTYTGTTANTNRHIFEIDMINGIGKVDNQQVNLSVQTIVSTRSLFLFARNNGSADLYCKEKIYSSQIYDNGTLVRNFVPVKRNSDNKPGMYDLVNNVFYVNQGTGEFVTGPELYSNNSQIDIRQKNNTNFVEKYKFNENNELVWANPQLNLSGPVNYTEVGTPTIVDGVVSGFSSVNYLTLPNYNQIVNSIEIVFKINQIPITITNNALICSLNSDFSFRSFVASTKKVQFSYTDINNTTKYVASTNTITNNTYCKFILNQSGAFLYFSSNNLDWTLEYSRTEKAKFSIINDGRIGYLSKTYNMFDGSIDLKETYIKVNDKLWFYGKNYTSENYAPVPAGLNYNNTTTPSIGYVNTQTQEFIPAPTDGIKYSQTRDIKVIPPEDNTITLLYGVASDFSKYGLFGLLASVSSGTYDVYIDDVLYATTASNTQTDIDFSTLGAEYVSIGTATTPESLVLHKIVIKPTTSGQTMTTFRARRYSSTSSGDQRQGTLWIHFELINPIHVGNLLRNGAYGNTLAKAITSKNNILNSLDGGYGDFALCYNLVYVPKNNINGQSLFLENRILKNVNYEIKEYTALYNHMYRYDYLLEKLNNLKYNNVHSSIDYCFEGVRKLKLLPKIISFSSLKSATHFITEASELYPTKINMDTANQANKIDIYGTSTYPMRGLRGLKVSNEAPFTGTSPQINVSYTGLDRDALVELFESMPGYMKLDKVGTPTIDSNGVASGFSASNYLLTNKSYNLNEISEIEIGFIFNKVNETNQTLLYSTVDNITTPFRIRSITRSLQISWTDNTETLQGIVAYENKLVTNTYYKVNVKFLSNKFYATLKDSNNNVLETAISGETTILNSSATNFMLGFAQNLYWQGSIDLKNSYIKINNARYQFQLPDDTTTRQINITAATGNNLTLSGNATIDNNEMLANVDSSSSCISPTLPTDFRTMEMLFKVKFPNASSGAYIPIVGFGSTSSYKSITGSGTSGHSLRYSSSITLMNIPVTDFNFVTTANDGYYIKLNVIKENNNYKYKLSLSTDKVTWVSKEVVSEYNACSGTVSLLRNIAGAASGKPQMFLSDTYIKVDNNYIVKGFLTDNDRAIATGKGWGITG